MADLITPTGYQYTPFFPIVKNILAMQDQRNRLAAKAAAEGAKTTDKLVTETMKQYFQFVDDKRPFLKVTEAHFQKQSDTLLEMSTLVRQGKLDPRLLQQALAVAKEDKQEAVRKNAFLTSTMKGWEKSGVMNMDYVRERLGPYAFYYNDPTTPMTDANGQPIIDDNGVPVLPPTHLVMDENGKPKGMTPRDFDVQGYADSTIVDLEAYNSTAMVENLYNKLLKNESEITASKNGNIVTSTKTIQGSLLSDLPNSGGHRTLDFGAEDSENSRRILNAFRSLGGEYETFLKVKASAIDPKFKTYDVGSEKWGIAMQKAAKATVEENGYGAPAAINQKYQQPRATGAGRAGGGGGVAAVREKERYEREAKRYVKLYSPDEEERVAAIDDLLLGKGVKNASYVEEGHVTENGQTLPESDNGYARIQLDRTQRDPKDPKVNQMQVALGLASVAQSPKDKEQGIFYVKLDKGHIGALASYSNIIKATDVDSSLLKEYLDKLEGAGGATAPQPKKSPGITINKSTTTTTPAAGGTVKKKKSAGITIK